MKNKILILSAFLFSLSFFACNGDEETGNVNSKPNSYFPLVQGNLWSYKTPGMALTDKVNFVATGIQTVNGNEYFTVTNGLTLDTLFLREDAAGNVYELFDKTTDFKIIDSEPVQSMTWQMEGGELMCEVESTQAIVNGWQGLIKIATYQNGAKIRIDYYKKGVGLIRQENGAGKEIMTLWAYDLK
jgi:hypothetical protein